MQLTAIIYPDSDTDWLVAECPETGTASQGKTEAEALANLREATELYLESFPQKNSVELRFVLREHEGVWMQCHTQGDAGYQDVGSDTASPWVDTRPVKVPGTPEWRDYRACWWDHSTPSMAFGPVLRVIVNG